MQPEPPKRKEFPTIDEFLNELGLGVESSPEEQQTRQPLPFGIRVVFADYMGDYYVHCARTDAIDTRLARTDMKGRFLRGQWTFPEPSLQHFSEAYEKALEMAEILYHREPPLPPLPSQDIISYRVVTREIDPLGEGLLTILANVTTQLYNNWSPAQQ